MTISDQTAALCRRYQIKPARSKGQNFLIREDIYDQIISAADLQPTDQVLEVGPGLGFLTERLAAKAERVAAVELDDKLAAVLGERLASLKVDNVVILNENILELKITNYELRIKEEDLKIKNYKIVANLPYNITSVFLRRFLSDENLRPRMMVLLVQREVAERMAAGPGEMSLLGVSVQYFAEPEIVGRAAADCFYPAPKVESAIVKLKTKSGLLDPAKEKDFFRLVKFGFAAKRKMLKNNLAAGYRIGQEQAENVIIKAGFDPRIRAEGLSVADWLTLFGYIEEIVV